MPPMNRLDTARRTQVLTLLLEGMSLRATARASDISYNTVCKLFVDAGTVAAVYQDEVLRDLPCKRLQLDEIWSFVYAKQKNVKGSKAAPADAGDAWTWVAIDADTKLVPSWRVGDRGLETAKEFVADLASRLRNRVQITSDGHRAYLDAIEDAFGGDVDFAQLIKIYGPELSAPGRYSPPACLGARKHRVQGEPDVRHVSTSYVERQNLTMRMSIRRFTRLTNAFSKKLDNHAHSVALHYLHYNFCRIHKSLKVTPAMAAGVTDKVWDVRDIVTLVENLEAPAAKRGPYKKKELAA